MNSAENVFAGITVTGCFFHLPQNIWRRIQENGLQPLYRNDPDFAKFMRMIAALALCHQSLTYPNLVMTLSTKFTIITTKTLLPSYLIISRITTLDANEEGDHVQHQVWNMYSQAGDELPKTNNHVEGWHWHFNANCDSVHPNLWKFIRSLQRELCLIPSGSSASDWWPSSSTKEKICPICRSSKEHRKRLPEQMGKYIELSTYNFP